MNINNIKMVLSAIMFLGLFPYLYYRDRMSAYVSLIGFIVILGLWAIYIIQNPWPRKIGWIILAIGATCNQIAIWSNGGKMPVADNFVPHGLWRPMVETDHVKFLCDIYWHSTSIGDLIALGGFMLLMFFALEGV